MTSTLSPIVYWFRHDLRLHDQPALHAALTHAQNKNVPFCPFWIWDQRWDQTDAFGTPRMGKHRARFLLQSVKALHTQLKAYNQSLLILRGDPVTLIPMLMKHFKATHLYASHHVADEEVQQQNQLKSQIPHFHLHWSHTLFTPDQLPFTLENLPDIYTQFRKKIEYHSPSIPLIPTPSSFPDPPSNQLSNTSSDSPLTQSLTHLDPLIQQWDQSDVSNPDPRTVLDFKGAEQSGIERVQHYLWQTRAIESYKQTRNGLVGADYSTKFSPWLSTGALSPRWIWQETLNYEDQRVANESTYWVRFELLWREYFQWVALKSKSRLFWKKGLKPHPSSHTRGQINQSSFKEWVQGSTDSDFVNANMKELYFTGFMSNRGRQNVASYLIHNLGVDWRMGAGYFEQNLIDYDPASNWGNWAYIAGVGNDPRPFRKFNLEKQTQHYDGKGHYRNIWL